jgi:hypothetical protein
MRHAGLLLVFLFGLGCATAGPEQPTEPFTLGGGGGRAAFDPAAYAARYPQPLECEVMARSLQASSREQAWSVLQACVSTGRFWPLRALLTPAWLPDLRMRPDAANLLARVVASRGGEVQTDLGLLHDARLPLFSLEDGLENPTLYTGRLVLVRAKVEELRHEGGTLIAALAERTLASERRSRQLGVSEIEAQDLTDTDQAPPVKGFANRHRGTWRSERRVEAPYYVNVSVDTGRLALASVPVADPFFEPGHEFLVLARFDGLEPPDDPRDAPVARLTLVSYQKPAGLVLY